MTDRIRTDWKAKYEPLLAEHEQLKERWGRSEVEIERLKLELDDLKKQVERARIQGMNDVTGMLLRGALDR